MNHALLKRKHHRIILDDDSDFESEDVWCGESQRAAGGADVIDLTADVEDEEGDPGVAGIQAEGPGLEVLRECAGHAGEGSEQVVEPVAAGAEEAEVVPADRDPGLARVVDGRNDRAPDARCGARRKFILVTLSHVARQWPRGCLQFALQRLCRVFDVARGVGVQERHADGEAHYHVALEPRNASSYTATKKIRAAFPEFTGEGAGRSLNVSFHKAFITMLQYVAKDQPGLEEAVFCGSLDKEGAVELLSAKRGKKSMAVNAVRQHVVQGKGLEDLVWDDDVASFMMTSYSSVMNYAASCKASLDNKPSLDRIREAAEGGDAAAASSKLNDDQKGVVKEFMMQLGGRRLRQPQLYVVGPTGSGKTYVFQLFQQCTNCFVPCLENGERAFAGYDDRQHDWIFMNDFHDNVKFQLLSNLCEGAQLTLNGYQGQKIKKKNCPVVFTANTTPTYKNLEKARVDALMDRLMVKHFTGRFAWNAEEINLADFCAYAITTIEK